MGATAIHDAAFCVKGHKNNSAHSHAHSQITEAEIYSKYQHRYFTVAIYLHVRYDVNVQKFKKSSLFPINDSK